MDPATAACPADACRSTLLVRRHDRASLDIWGKTFVANRNGSIHEIIFALQWGHLSTQGNPAAAASAA